MEIIGSSNSLPSPHDIERRFAVKGDKVITVEYSGGNRVEVFVDCGRECQVWACEASKWSRVE